MTRNKKVTMVQVSEDAGVSVPAVSKVIRNAYGVSDSLRTKVNESIKKLGYRPNISARALRGKTYTVGILVVDQRNLYLADLLENLSKPLSEAGYKTLIGVGHNETYVETELIESMLDHNVDGIIVVSPRLAGQQLNEFSTRVPMVVIGHHDINIQNFDTVNSDDQLGSMLATEELIQTGISNIYMFSLKSENKSEHDVFHQRELGFTNTLKKHQLDTHETIFPMSDNGIKLRHDIERFLTNIVKPCAIFCWSDIHAIPLLDIAHSQRLKLKDDFCVVGYDNVPIAAHSLISLSSVDQKACEQGRVAAEVLLDRIAGRTKAKHILIPPTLVKRSTS